MLLTISVFSAFISGLAFGYLMGLNKGYDEGYSCAKLEQKIIDLENKL